jgi:hypothetical protein
MAIKMDDAIGAYLKLRTALAALKDQHKVSEGELQSKLNKLEAFFLDFLNKSGTDNIAVRDVGTVFKQDVHSVKINDWDAALTWIKDNGAWEFLEKRLAKSAVQDFAQSTNELPPGVELSTTVEVRIRKS